MITVESESLILQPHSFTCFEISSVIFLHSSAALLLFAGISHKSPEKTNNFWESFPAPPAFASELPSKDALLQLSSIKSSSQASSDYAPATGGMLRISNMTLMGNGINWSFGKNGEVNLCLCFQLAKDGPVPGAAAPSRTAASGSWSWLCCLSMLAILIPVFKLGSYLWARWVLVSKAGGVGI